MLAVSADVAGKLAVKVRPLGSMEVIVTVQAALPGAELGMGVQLPLLERTSLETADVSVMGARTLGSMGMTMSGAVKVIVAEED
jgi:hypothetical protein